MVLVLSKCYVVNSVALLIARTESALTPQEYEQRMVKDQQVAYHCPLNWWETQMQININKMKTHDLIKCNFKLIPLNLIHSFFS